MKPSPPSPAPAQSPDAGIPDCFHPEIREWFSARYSGATDIQQQAWPAIAAHQHVLISAPTGSGKTLTAFLWAIDQLVNQAWPQGAIQVLYVSPLKALNNDVQRNLLAPLAEIRQHLEAKDLPVPSIRVLTRSGDTPQSERQRMIRKPPEILITTPESLNLLLSSRHAASLFSQVKTVILDEIHALVPSKRGVFLMTAIERLALLAGEFQRIALSATVNPLADVARFVGGFQLSGPTEAPEYQERPVAVLESKAPKIYSVTTCLPDAAADAPPEETIWTPVAAECKRLIANNRSTLIFTNNRALCEKVTLLINAGESDRIAYSHHGSLSREIRLEVEQRLKAGELKAIVATNSLELGIDIGELDQVILIQCPGSVASTIQRLGRAGHGVGQVSRGHLITTHPRDYLETAAMLGAVQARTIEPTRLIQGPLDLLPQVLVSMVATGTWTRQSAFHAIRSCAAYHDLSQRAFDLVLNMMLGRFAESRISELRPLIGVESRSENLILRQGTLQRLYLNSGVIPNRGYYHLRHTDSQSRIGELDEEFVWEASIGQTLTMGTQNWKIDRITHNDVFVSPANPKAPGIPFWRAEDLNRSHHFSERIGAFLQWADTAVEQKDCQKQLTQEHGLDDNTAQALIEHLKDQKRHSECALPHAEHVLVEITSTGPGSVPGNQVVLHTLWGGQINRPYAMALEQAWRDRFETAIEIQPSNDCVALVLPQDVPPEILLELVTAENLEALLRRHLESSGFFAARFRECAGRALLISKRKFSERMPLWMSRLRSQKLFDAVSQFSDFPITLETWRTCLYDEFDLPHLIEKLAALASGTITWTAIHTHQPTPMARAVAWRQVNDYLYRPDASRREQLAPSLNESLLEELLANESLRPKIPSAVIADFVAKRLRLAPGYSPDSATELMEWLKERILVQERDWQTVLDRMVQDHSLEKPALYTKANKQVLRLARGNAPAPVCHENIRPALDSLWTDAKSGTLEGLTSKGTWQSLPTKTKRRPRSSTPEGEAPTPESLLLEWFQFYGPLTADQVAQHWALPLERMETWLKSLVDQQLLIAGFLEEGSDTLQYCEPDNLEALLRLKRRASQPTVTARPAAELQWFLAAHHGLVSNARHPAPDLLESLQQLLFYPAPCALWESEIFPARQHPYAPRSLDLELEESQILWLGAGKEAVQFAYEAELPIGTEPGAPPRETELLPHPTGKFDFNQLTTASQLAPSELVTQLWNATWKGHLTNDRFATLRHGIQNNFQMKALTLDSPARRGRFHSRPTRSTLSKWQGSRPNQGSWHYVPETVPPEPGIEHEEVKKDRVRLLLDRYGILARDLLIKESTPFSWRSVFRTLRLMEYSGELISGYFFEGLSGPQFLSPRTLRHFQEALPEKLFWLNAADPVSLAGIAPPECRANYPKRLASNHLVFSGPKLILCSERYARRLTIYLEPDDPSLPEAYAFLRHLVSRNFQPLPRVVIETINDQAAASSAYLESLRSQFEVVVEPGRLSIYRDVVSAGTT